VENVENVGNTVEDLRNEELHSEMIYISKDGVEGYIGEFGSNSLNKEGNEENIVESNEEVGGKESFEQNKEDYNHRNAHESDDTMHGHGVRGTNSNIMGRHWFTWQGATCNLVDDVGVFLAKRSCGCMWPT
jgi:hypothetical protein